MTKSQRIDKINDAFAEIMVEENAQEYERFIKEINREIIDNIDRLTPSLVREIVNKQDINIESVTLMTTILNAILLIINNPKDKNRDVLAPIAAFAAMYSLSQPKRFVRKLVKVSKGKGLSAKEKQAKKFIDRFKDRNKNTLESIRKQSVENMKIATAKSTKFKSMAEDFQRMQSEGKSMGEVGSALRRKYNDRVAIKRALRTEIHAQTEFIKAETSKGLGYKYKIWRTQRDSRVRETNFHKQVANQKVLVDREFQAGSLRANVPGDERLPANDRINCRCYLIYE